MDASCHELDPGLLQTSSGFSLSLAGHISRESGPRDYSSLPSFFSSPSLSFSAFSHFTHLQPDGLLTEMESQAQLLQQHPPSSLSGAKPSNLFPSGEHGRCLCLPNSIRVDYKQREHQWHRAHQHWKLKKEKRQRRKHAPHGQQFRRAQLPECRFPAKFGYQPIKLEIYLLAHTYTAKYVRVQLRHLGVYKES